MSSCMLKCHRLNKQILLACDGIELRLESVCLGEIHVEKCHVVYEISNSNYWNPQMLSTLVLTKGVQRQIMQSKVSNKFCYIASPVSGKTGSWRQLATFLKDKYLPGKCVSVDCNCDHSGL